MDWRGALSTRPRWQKWAAAAALALLVYALFGFFVAPRIVRSQGETALRDALDREVVIGDVDLNPFVLSVTVRDFSVEDRDGSPFVRFDLLHVDFQLSSIVRRAFTFSEIRLEAPYVHVEIGQDGALNFADLLASAAEPDAGEEPPPAEEEGGPPALLVGHARVVDGTLLFSDLSHETPFEHEVSPLDVELRDFGTRPDDESPYSFEATTGAGETLSWEGTVSVVPPYSSGRFTLGGVKPRTGWLYVQDDVFFEVVDGMVDVSGHYEVDTRDGLAATLEEGEIRIRDLAIVDRDTDEPVVEIPAFDVEGIAISYPEQTVKVDSVTTTGGRYHMLRLADGRLRLEQLLRTRSSTADAETAAAGADEADAAAVAAETTGASGQGGREASGEKVEDTLAAPAPDADEGQESGPGWSVAIDHVASGGLRLEWEDRSTSPHAGLVLEPIAFQVQDVTNDLTRPVRVGAEVGVGEEGRITVEGPVTVAPLDADLRVSVDALDLRPFEPYWASQLAVDLSSGRLGVKGAVRVRDAGAPDAPRITFAGDVRVESLQALGAVTASELAAWSALELDGLSVTVAPTSLALERLTLRDPALHVVVDEDGTANWATLTVGSAEAPAGPPPGDEPPDAAPPPVSIALVEISGGTIDFEDRTVAPRFTTGLERIAGRIEGLDSDVEARAELALEGAFDGATPVTIAGELSPLSPEPFVDLRIAFDNFELTPFTPYSGRYIGREIARGKLFVELEYVLRGVELAGENELFLDQFTLGEGVDSPDAVDLPVGLAIGLLKDRKGEIHIDLPIRGRVDDPEFSIAGLVGRALRNLVLKVATSPFSMLGKLAGSDGDSLRYVEFAPGSARVEPGQAEEVAALAQALTERPALSLEITGGADEPVDRPALQTASLETELRRRRYRELESSRRREAPASVDAVVLSSEDRTRLLRRLFEERFDEDVDDVLPSVAGSAPDGQANADPAVQEAARLAEVERRVRESIAVDRSSLRELARQRASAVRDRLVADGVSAERVFVLDVETGGDEAPAESAGARARLDIAVH